MSDFFHNIEPLIELVNKIAPLLGLQCFFCGFMVLMVLQFLD